jgi:hypothetical protein
VIYWSNDAILWLPELSLPCNNILAGTGINNQRRVSELDLEIFYGREYLLIFLVLQPITLFDFDTAKSDTISYGDISTVKMNVLMKSCVYAVEVFTILLCLDPEYI